MSVTGTNKKGEGTRLMVKELHSLYVLLYTQPEITVELSAPPQLAEGFHLVVMVPPLAITVGPWLKFTASTEN